MCFDWERVVYQCERPPPKLNPCNHLAKYRPKRRCEKSPHSRESPCDPPINRMGLPERRETEPTCYHPGRCCEVLIEQALTGWRKQREFVKAGLRDLNVPSHTDDRSVEWGKLVEDPFQYHRASCNFHWTIADIVRKRDKIFRDYKLYELKGREAPKSSFKWLW